MSASYGRYWAPWLRLSWGICCPWGRCLDTKPRRAGGPGGGVWGHGLCKVCVFQVSGIGNARRQRDTLAIAA